MEMKCRHRRYLEAMMNPRIAPRSRAGGTTIATVKAMTIAVLDPLLVVVGVEDVAPLLLVDVLEIDPDIELDSALDNELERESGVSPSPGLSANISLSPGTGGA